MSSAKWRPFCFSITLLTDFSKRPSPPKNARRPSKSTGMSTNYASSNKTKGDEERRLANYFVALIRWRKQRRFSCHVTRRGPPSWKRRCSPRVCRQSKGFRRLSTLLRHREVSVEHHESHNAPVPYPTIHHIWTEIGTFLFWTRWCIVGYGTDALWDFWGWSIGSRLFRTKMNHDDVIKWEHFPRNWPFVQEIHRCRWISGTKASDAELCCFLWSAPE